MKPLCVLDMDEVLVDLVHPLADLHKVSLRRAQMEWGLAAQFGITDAKLWADCGFDFWAGLPWCDEGKELLAGLEELFGQENIVLATSPVLTPGCQDGKRAWVEKHLPAYRRRLQIGAAKWSMAGPSSLLVDDHDGNVSPFRERGGGAVVVPRPWNSRRKECGEQGNFDPDKVLAECQAWNAGRLARALS